MNYKIALLIDAENISDKYAGQIFDALKPYGSVVIRRIYGDWSSPNQQGWKSAILEYGLHAMQQFPCTSGKNTSDCLLIVDAMDILHSGKADAFCLVSSDSDFTRLLIRLREDGIYLMGMGENKTPETMRRCCDVFITLPMEKAAKRALLERVKKAKKLTAPPKSKLPPPADQKALLEVIKNYLRAHPQGALSDAISNRLHEQYEGFTFKPYLKRKPFVKFLQEQSCFNCQRQEKGGQVLITLKMPNQPADAAGASAADTSAADTSVADTSAEPMEMKEGA